MLRAAKLGVITFRGLHVPGKPYRDPQFVAEMFARMHTSRLYMWDRALTGASSEVVMVALNVPLLQAAVCVGCCLFTDRASDHPEGLPPWCDHNPGALLRELCEQAISAKAGGVDSVKALAAARNTWSQYHSHLVSGRRRIGVASPGAAHTASPVSGAVSINRCTPNYPGVAQEYPDLQENNRQLFYYYNVTMRVMHFTAG